MTNKSINISTHRPESTHAYKCFGVFSKLESCLSSLEYLLASNFVVAHYCYILSWIVMGSFLIYVIGNVNTLNYLDLLFFCCSASTQTGLSTVVVKELTLFQQIVLYFSCAFTTPIFIHGSLIFIRLFWYKKEFEDIETISIYQYELRRTNTIAELRAGISRSGTSYFNEAAAEGMNLYNSSQDLALRLKNIDNYSASVDQNPKKQDIRFADLPKPRKRASHYTDEASDRIFNFDSDIEGETDEEEDEANLLRTVSVQNSRGRKRGRFNIFKRKLELKKMLLNQDNELNGSIDSSIVTTYGKTNDDKSSIFRGDYTYGSIDAEDTKFAEDNCSLRRSHTSVMSDTIRKIRNSVFKRTLTSYSNRTFTLMNLNELNDEELLDFATRNHVKPFVWGFHGRNFNHIPFTKQQKEELDGIEYQAMKLLGRVIFGYYFGILVISTLCLFWLVRQKKGYEEILVSDGCLNSTWWAFFTALSAFSNEGLTLNISSFKVFDQEISLLSIITIIVLAGNIVFPINLRILVWTLRLMTRPSTMAYDSLTFLLEHPRRCFTLIFPSGATWWLLFVLICMNMLDWALFAVLDFGRESLSYLPEWYKGFDGLFQVICTRTTGFNVFQLADFSHAFQLSYVVMMYLSALPLAISIRSTNVYEDQSLGIYKLDEETAYTKPKLEYIVAHIRKQLSDDIWFIFCAVFIICVVEGQHLDAGDIDFDIFRVIFEVVSAYGTVGLTLGYPGSFASFCGEFHAISKLVIMVAMLRGRHRDLPNAIDRSILLPGKKLNSIDDKENEIHLQRVGTDISGELTGGYL